MPDQAVYEQRLLDLYDGYAHGLISRRHFLDRAAALSASGLSAAAILAALSPDQACKHFFGRVKACASSINHIKAVKLGLKGAQRTSYVRQRTEQLNRAFSNVDLLCERYERKARKQRTDMNKCYRQTSCEKAWMSVASRCTSISGEFFMRR